MNYFKIHLLYFFRYVILNIGDGLMKIRCEMCGKKFDPDDARSRYDSEWGDGEYDSDAGGRDICFDCLNVEAEGFSNQGRAIDIMKRKVQIVDTVRI